MAELEPLSLEELEAAAEAFAALVDRGLNDVMEQVLDEAGLTSEDLATLSPSDVDRVTVLWEAFVAASLLPFLAAGMANANEETATALIRALGVELPFLDEPLDTQRYLSQARNRLVGIGNELWFNARTAIAEGLAEGESIPTIAARVREVVGVTSPRAQVIARTESHGARNAVNAATVRRVNAAAGAPGAIRRRWQATSGDRTRETHRRADGQEVALDEPFIVGRASLDFPGDPSGPAEEVINCVTEDTEIDFSSLRGVTRRWYVGDIVSLRFSAGNELTVTPNHPILRSDGVWCAAGDLVEGDHCVYDSGSRWFAGTPNKEVPPTTIGEIYRSTRELGNTQRVRTSPPDFHGDGSEGDIDVIPVFGNLRFEGNPATEQEIAQFGLSLADQARTCMSSAQGGPLTAGVSAGGEISSGTSFIVGVPRQSATLVDAQSSHTQTISLTGRTLGETESRQVATDDVSVGVESPSHFEDTHTFGVHGANRFNIEWDTNAAPGFTRVEQVRRVAFSGYVYNLDTGVGWYNANGITIRNCRCTTITVIDVDALNLDELSTTLTLNAAAYQEDEDMPWSIIEGDERCDAGEFAVVKDEDNELEGCHATRAEAEDQIAALNIAEAEEGDDTSDEDPAAAAAALSGRNTVPWSGVIVVEGTPTGDGRQFAPQSLTWPEVGAAGSLEIPLGWMYERAHGGMQTDKVVTVGRIDTITRKGNELHATGLMDLDSPMGREAARMMGTRENPGFLAGVSIDADDPEDPNQLDVEFIFPDSCAIDGGAPVDDGEAEIDMQCMVPELVVYHSGRIRAATLVDIPAYVEARLYLDEEPAVDGAASVESESVDMPVTAAAYTMTIPDLPPAEWFTEPTDEPDIGAITVTDDGRIFGYLAPKHVAHRGYRDKRVEVPTGNVDYGVWMNRTTIAETADGEFQRIATGPITMDCGHASGSPHVRGAARRDHYDNSCSVVATVRAGENARGVWIAGAVLPDVTPEQVRRMMACQLSGDWGPHREKPGKRELAAALLVPVPGFPKRTYSHMNVSDGYLSRVSVPVRFGVRQEKAPEAFGTKAAADRIAASIGRDRESRVHTFATHLRDILKGV